MRRSSDPAAAQVLEFVLEQRLIQDAAAAQELRGILAWADLHRVDAEDMVACGALDPAVRRMAFDDDSVAAELGREGELRLGGDGAALVSEFAVTELAAALKLSETSARHLVGQSIELRERLPRLFTQVLAGAVPAWKARQIAKATIRLNTDAAGFVDAQLAPFAARLSLTRIDRAVDAAIMRHDPVLAKERAVQAGEHRGVWLHDETEGTTRLDAVLDTPDAHAFDTAVNTVAGTLAALGDTDPDQVRRAKALGVLADPQYALDLAASQALAAADPDVAAVPPRRTGNSGKGGPTIHVHLHTDAIAGFDAVARVTGGGLDAGPRPIAAIRRWLADLTPGARVTVTPVVDLNEHISVDAYEIPDRLRAQITERDVGCVFPWCGRQGHHDLDHTDPYVPLDEGGPPGQTSTTGLARLCRFHHRVKTHGRWRYRRRDATTVEWTSPHGRTYIVDHPGTRSRD